MNKKTIYLFLIILAGIFLVLWLWQGREKEPQTDEEALKEATSSLENGDMNRYLALKEIWEPKSEKRSAWFMLEADRLMTANDPDRAKAWLFSENFEGTEDAPRLLHLAILEFDQNPESALSMFRVALETDSDNPELYQKAARQLEKIDRFILAQEAYSKAVSLDPNSARQLLALGEFYLRQGQIPLALLTFKKASLLPSSEKEMSRLAFWSKVVQPFELTAKEGFAAYVLSLPEKVFWDERGSLYETLPESRSEARWLKWLQAISENKGSETPKAQLSPQLSSNSIIRPDLEAAFLLALNYQKSRKISLASPYAEMLEKTPSRGLLKQLSSYVRGEKKMPTDLKLLVKSPEIFTALLLDASWDRAALGLNPSETIPEKYPAWLPYKLTEAVQRIDGNQAAFEFALKQALTPSMKKLIGELEIAIGRPSDGFKSLISARMALLKGNEEEAGRHYRNISDHSSEAVEFFIRQNPISEPSTPHE